MKLIDGFLNSITMYRLILYYLIGLLVVAAILSFLGILSFSIIALMFSVSFLVTVSWVINWIFAKTFQVPTNIESVYITALILALIITPIKSFSDLPFLFWAATWSQASKYILAIGKKHLFNPVAFAAALTALTLNQSSTWWVGTVAMLPFVLIGGLLIVRKIRREELVLSFFLMAFVAVLGYSLTQRLNIISAIQRIILDSPLLFLGFVMLTEPLTTPPTRILQIIYGGLVGFLFAPQVHLGNIYSTPELALLGGNIFSYLVSPKVKLVLKLKEKVQKGPDVYDFVFQPDKKLTFLPGQYLEWTLEHYDSDSRGNRRYFTIASSPTENELRLGIKLPARSSSFKRSLLAMQEGSKIMASGLAGDFVLPKDPREKLVFIAGGIGITPFRSMFKYLLDTNQLRSIVLFYSNNTASEIVYKEIFDEAEQRLGIKTVYTLTDIQNIPLGWQGRQGYITEDVIRTEVPDFKDRKFYLSGPHSMVTAFEKVLKKMGIGKEQIVRDYFPGF